MPPTAPRASMPDYLRITPSGEIYLKSHQTRPRFLRMLGDNLRSGLAASRIGGDVIKSGHHELRVETRAQKEAAEIAARTFGVTKVELVRERRFAHLEDLAQSVARLARSRVTGREFAVRVRRSGKHNWRSQDVERRIGTLLLEDSAGVNLDNPEITVRVHVRGDAALIVQKEWAGPDGLPVGTQDRALVLLSGGIDSPVAAWMMMRRGCPVDLLHFKLDCAQSDHALSVGYELIERWGHGPPSKMHVLDFEPLKDALQSDVTPDYRQIVLKQQMIEAAGRLATQAGITMLVTGDSLGQVSSQTAANLVAIDKFSELPILRPLLGFSKEEIVGRAHSIGTYELSIRAREVCDLSHGHPVIVAATPRQLEAAVARVDSALVADALATWETIGAMEWRPGVPLTPAA